MNPNTVFLLEEVDHQAFCAVLYEYGKPVAQYNLWLHRTPRFLTGKLISFMPGQGHARRVIVETIAQLEEIAAKHGEFTHLVELTPQGEVLRHIFEKELGYQTPGARQLFRTYSQR